MNQEKQHAITRQTLHKSPHAAALYFRDLTLRNICRSITQALYSSLAWIGKQFFQLSSFLITVPLNSLFIPKGE
jgi:hypothetical protein